MEPPSPERSSQLSSLCRYFFFSIFFLTYFIYLIFFFFQIFFFFLHFRKRVVKMPILDVTKNSGTMHKSLLPPL